MRRGTLLALLALAACSQPLPPGVERLAGASDSQSFAWSPASRRLAYVEGRFPDRTYLVVLDRATGAKTKRRLKGFVLGGATALSRDGRLVFLDAGKLGAYASRNEPVERVLLVVNPADGRIVSENPIGVAGVVALGHPAWSADPVAVWNGKDGIHWQTFGPSQAGGVLPGPAAWRALLLDEPYLVVSEKQTERPRMTVYDLRDGRLVAEWRPSRVCGGSSTSPSGRCRTGRRPTSRKRARP